MLRAVIFDMDGVIIDSEPLHVEVVLAILEALDIHLSPDAIMKYVGRSNSAMWAELAGEHCIDTGVSRLMDMQHAMNIRALNRHDDIMLPGIPGLLSAIRMESLAAAIASSSPRDYIEAVVDKLRLGPWFDAVVSGEEVRRGKPAPDVFLKAAGELGVAAADCAVIEDSAHGVAAALSAGMKVVGFRNPNSGNQDLSRAHGVVDSIEEITVDLLRGLG